MGAMRVVLYSYFKTDDHVQIEIRRSWLNNLAMPNYEPARVALSAHSPRCNCQCCRGAKRQNADNILNG